MDELLARLAEVADLERAAVLLACDQEVCMPPAGVAGHGELRATIGRPAHERFTDEQVGERLEAAQPRDDIEVDAVRVARRDVDKASRVPVELIAEIARTGAAARLARHDARQR
jgi:carboxypeptidase Taq